jgi:ATP-dependent helicase/nuclease subunit B
MLEEIFRALESGATVITASRRLARELSGQFHSIQTDRGRAVWTRPDVLPLEALLDRMWGDWLSRYADENGPVLLNAAQEQMLWEQVIRDSPHGASLLQIRETARQAVESWRLVVEYRLPMDGSFEASEDWAAFAGWWREFRRRTNESGWLERARLADFLREKIAAQQLPRPTEIFIAGFDEMTPQQTKFLDALGKWRTIETRSCSPSPKRRKLRDTSAEMRAAALWARRLIEADPQTRIGIVVAPDLTRSRAKMERILDQVLAAGSNGKDRDRPFHLSIGPALEEYPVVRAALLALEFASATLTLPRVGMLLRSPFLAGAEKEWSKRAQLDAKLRRKGRWDVSISDLIEEVGSCPDLLRVLRRAKKQLRKIATEQSPDDWKRSMEDLLEAFGWPGDRAPSSSEFQIIAAWRGLLSELGAMDLTAMRMNFAQVLDWLHWQAAKTRFQVEDEGAPVQVMGMLEAAGLRFDHLWILGLHDEALPAAANPNPFIPISLQRAYRMPHSSADRELAFASSLMERLIASAPDVILSYPETEGDRALAPSPLLADGEWTNDIAAPGNDWIIAMRASSVFEEIADAVGPALAQSGSTGGSSLFKDMAACPFRAFSKHRLAARPLEETDLGLSYRDRGTTVHKALEFVWRELGSRARLAELTLEDLQTLIARAAGEAVAKLGPGIGRDLEKQRLQKLLTEWLEIERSRPEFSVAGNEMESVVEVGGLQVKTRADRVDELPDGRRIILDYKTGQLKARGWEGERPDEPQLPLYCATSDHRIGGAAFAMIRTGELRFRGLTASDVSLPAMTRMPIDPPIPFDLQLAEWRRVLETLAERFRAGDAQVDPKPGACDNCGLRTLCRIRELEHDRG